MLENAEFVPMTPEALILFQQEQIKNDIIITLPIATPPQSPRPPPPQPPPPLLHIAPIQKDYIKVYRFNIIWCPDAKPIYFYKIILYWRYIQQWWWPWW